MRPVRGIVDWIRARNRERLARRRAARPPRRPPEQPPELHPSYRRAAAPVAPTPAEWEGLFAEREARPRRGEPLVDVVVPVYRGVDDTLRCLYRILEARCETPHAVVVVDDASPEPELVAELRRLASAGGIELLRHERNAGFVAACNRGMALHPDRDVVLLNSDTEVYGDWLDRLRAAAHRDERTATVTPLSNNATICSYPYFPCDNEMALELEYAELDALAARVNAGRALSVPTAVGFCMYVRRACLDEVGLFDLERFGRGYGEENDLSLRASERGWGHLLACDVFVRHTGGVSFGAEKQERIARGLAELRRTFPHYEAEVARFVAADPPREARERLDLARMARRVGSGGVLFVTHRWGGGIERHVDDLRRRLEAEGTAVFFLRPDTGDPNLAVLSRPSVWPTPNVRPFDLREGSGPLASALRSLGVSHVHVHSLVGFDQPAAADWISSVARAVGVRLDFTVHDYLYVCPRTNLVDGSGSYCGEPGVEGCERCLAANGSPFGKVALREWRAAYEALLREARAVIAPGDDVAARVERNLPGLALVVRPHLEEPVLAPAPDRRAEGEPLRVAVIGSILPHKGFEVLRACARDAAARGLPLAFRLFGRSSDDDALTTWGNVAILGRYDDRELPELLARERCHCFLLPSVWPETYSYTLSAAIAAGLHPVSFDTGVPAERIRKLRWGTLVPLGASAAALNAALLATEDVPRPSLAELRASFARCGSALRYYYESTPLVRR